LGTAHPLEEADEADTEAKRSAWGGEKRLKAVQTLGSILGRRSCLTEFVKQSPENIHCFIFTRTLEENNPIPSFGDLYGIAILYHFLKPDEKALILDKPMLFQRIVIATQKCGEFCN